MDITLENLEIIDYTIEKYKIEGIFHDGLVIARNLKTHKYGYLNAKGEEVISCQFDVARDFSEGIAWVRQDEKYKAIDKAGNIKFVCPSSYIEVGDFHDGMAVFYSGKRRALFKYPLCGYIDKKGKVVINEFIPLGVELNKDGTFKLSEIEKMKILAELSFHNGLVAAGFYRDGHKEETVYLGKNGKIYYATEELARRYNERKPVTEEESLKEDIVLKYCSEVNFLGEKVVLKANNELELIQKKKELFAKIRSSITSFEETLTMEEEKLNPTSKPKVYQLEDKK